MTQWRAAFWVKSFKVAVIRRKWFWGGDGGGGGGEEGWSDEPHVHFIRSDQFMRERTLLWGL